MWSGDSSNDVYSQLKDAGNDVYGFEPIVLPPLPSGKHLAISELGTPLPRVGDGEDDDEAMMRALQEYVDACDSEDNTGVGGELWPAAEFLCRWLMSDGTADAVQGASVLELGAGTGACGLFAAGLGASRVVLTDAFADSLSLCEANAEANAQHYADGAQVSVERLPWGESLPPSILEDGAFEWVIGSDLTYFHEAHDELAHTLRALLTRGSEAAGRARSTPRVVLAHEHRSRDYDLPWLKEGVTSASWDAGDPHIELFGAAARRQGLDMMPLVCERPRCTERGGMRSWR